MISYRIDAAGARAHLFRVTLRVARPAREQVVSLPVWIPGSYLVREFARHLSGLRAHQGRHECSVRQLDKASWLVRCEGAAALTLDYSVYAFDPSVRAAFLDGERGFFNPTSLCLRVHDREAGPHAIAFAGLPRGWQIATAMPSAGDGRGYAAPDYDALADHPFELGRFWRGSFVACGVAHEFVVAGAWPGFDGARLLADTRRICETQIAFWHGANARGRDLPFDRYVFLLNAVDEGQGGLEHRASTALLAPRRKLPRIGMAPVGGMLDDGYADLLGLISHEYFHTWNVKRMRPTEFARLDYTQENYTELLWFFEGFTSYYDDLMLRRAGLVDDARYLSLLAKNVNAVLGAPGRRVQSVAQASFDAWVKYYRSDENTPNATISYYAKGALVALALDLTLRRDGSSLDEVMRTLWKASDGGPIGEADIAAALQQCGGRSYERELAEWVHGTVELPLQGLLYSAGIEWQSQPATIAQRVGLRVNESALTGVKATHVLRGGAAEAAGIAAGDEILAVAGWRLRRLDDAQRVLTPGEPAELLVARDQRVLTLRVTLPADAGLGAPVQLVADAKPGKVAQSLREAWLTR